MFINRLYHVYRHNENEQVKCNLLIAKILLISATFITTLVITFA